MTIPQGRDCWEAADKPIAVPERCMEIRRTGRHGSGKPASLDGIATGNQRVKRKHRTNTL